MFTTTTRNDKSWFRRWLHRRRTIRGMMAEWRWSRKAATHAYDVWGFNPWKRV